MPLPQIQLLAEHTAVEYGLVKFREGDANLWLPLSAEVYFAWRGQRVHRRHSFDHYMLFRVDVSGRSGVNMSQYETAASRTLPACPSPYQ